MNAIAIDAHPSSQIQLTSLDLFDPLRPLDSPGPLGPPGPLDSSRLFDLPGPLDPPRPYDPPGHTIPWVYQDTTLMQALLLPLFP